MQHPFVDCKSFFSKNYHTVNNWSLEYTTQLLPNLQSGWVNSICQRMLSWQIWWPQTNFFLQVFYDCIQSEDIIHVWYFEAILEHFSSSSVMCLLGTKHMFLHEFVFGTTLGEILVVCNPHMFKSMMPSFTSVII